eukprot:jgi/Bigna1/125485/aug1.1_g193
MLPPGRPRRGADIVGWIFVVLAILCGHSADAVHTAVMLNTVTGPSVLPNQTQTMINYFMEYLNLNTGLKSTLHFPFETFEYFEVNSDDVANVSTYIASNSSFDLVMAPYSSGFTETVVEAMQSTSKLVISAGASSTSLFFTTDSAGRRSRSSLNTADTYMNEFVNLVRYNGAATIAFAYVDSTFTEQACLGASQVASESGMTVLSTDIMESYNSSAPQVATEKWKSLIAQYKESRPDVLVVCSYSLCSSFLNQAYRSVLDNYLPNALAFTVCGEEEITVEEDIPETGTYLQSYTYFTQQWHRSIDRDNWRESNLSSVALFPYNNGTHNISSATQLYNRGASYVVSKTEEIRGRGSSKGVYTPSFFGILTNNGFGFNEDKPFSVVQYSSTGTDQLVVGPFLAASSVPIYPMPSWDDRRAKNDSEDYFLVIGVSALFGLLFTILLYLIYYWYKNRKSNRQKRNKLLMELLQGLFFLFIELADFFTDILSFYAILTGSFSTVIRVAYSTIFVVAGLASIYNVYIRTWILRMLWRTTHLNTRSERSIFTASIMFSVFFMGFKFRAFRAFCNYKSKFQKSKKDFEDIGITLNPHQHQTYEDIDNFVEQLKGMIREGKTNVRISNVGIRKGSPKRRNTRRNTHGGESASTKSIQNAGSLSHTRADRNALPFSPTSQDPANPVNGGVDLQTSGMFELEESSAILIRNDEVLNRNKKLVPSVERAQSSDLCSETSIDIKRDKNEVSPKILPPGLLDRVSFRQGGGKTQGTVVKIEIDEKDNRTIFIKDMDDKHWKISGKKVSAGKVHIIQRAPNSAKAHSTESTGYKLYKPGTSVYVFSRGLKEWIPSKICSLTITEIFDNDKRLRMVKIAALVKFKERKGKKLVKDIFNRSSLRKTRPPA